MRSIIINKYGSKDVLKLKNIDKPEVGEDEVLIKIAYAGVNPIDWKVRNGEVKLFFRIKFPYTPGSDIAGEVVKVGNNVENFKIGDQVFTMIPIVEGGGYQEYVSVAKNLVVKKPSNISDKEAAAVPMTALTALQSLRDKGKIKKGDNVLINGASGGVGIMAVQIAKSFGAKVTAVCGSDNIEMMKNLGADKVIDYKKEDFTDGDANSYDLIFDAVAKSTFSKCKGILKPTGTFVITVPGPGEMFRFLLTKIGFSPKCEFLNVNSNQKDLKLIKKLIEEEKLKIIIDKEYSLEDIAKAHEYSEGGRAIGKIVIKVAGE